tara:strand:+ start:7556 stop:8152 length:597 start_codon:yes stop_codon:yes gene_type:complete
LSKGIIQLLLIFLVIIIGVLTYQKYFNNQISISSENQVSFDESSLNKDKQSNLIKNLKYDVNFDNNTQYTITANYSEIKYLNQEEIVTMKKVVAIFIDEDGYKLRIKSDEAVFNNTVYNTTFEKNVDIEYIDHKIRSEKLILNFEENVVIIKDNIVYEGTQGHANADNIKMDLISKNIEIFMNKPEKKVVIIQKIKNE